MKDKMDALLSRSLYGHISTLDKDGYPYTIGANVLYSGGKFYFHCAAEGEKLDNIKKNPKVCVNIDELFEIKTTGVDEPCKVGVRYESVVARGRAAVVADEDMRLDVLKKIAAKYAPGIAGRPMPGDALERTCVVAIEVDNMTYKERL